MGLVFCASAYWVQLEDAEKSTTTRKNPRSLVQTSNVVSLCRAESEWKNWGDEEYGSLIWEEVVYDFVRHSLSPPPLLLVNTLAVYGGTCCFDGSPWLFRFLKNVCINGHNWKTPKNGRRWLVNFFASYGRSFVTQFTVFEFQKSRRLIFSSNPLDKCLLFKTDQFLRWISIYKTHFTGIFLVGPI